MGFVRVGARNNETILEVLKEKVCDDEKIESFKKQVISRLVEENKDFLYLSREVYLKT